ncbi:MAG: hypothetical protein ACP5U2_03860 [Bryobacteraceae bacterium]
MNAKEFALYFQDNFTVNSRLILNHGVRSEMYTPIRESHNLLTGFDRTTKSIVNAADLDRMLKIGAILPSIVKIFSDMGVRFISPKDAGLPDNLIYLNKWDLNPIAGFAYRFSDSARSLVLRDGYSIFGYPMPLRAFNARMRQNPPTTARFTYQLSNSAQTPDKLPNWGLRSVPSIVAGVNSRDVLNLNNFSGISRGSFLVSYFGFHQRTSQAHEWNITFEREIFDNTVVRAGYAGTHACRLDMYYSYNREPTAYVWYVTTGEPLPTGTYAGTAMRVFDETTYDDIEVYQKIGWSNSRNLQFEIQRRYRRGLDFQLFYVLSNTLKAGVSGWEDDVLPPAEIFLPGAVPKDNRERARFLFYRRDTDIPQHRYNWNFIVDVPFGRGKRWLGNAGPVLHSIAGGWQLAGMGSITSTWWALPTSSWLFPNKLEIYGDKYKVKDCRSGVCQDAYLYYNGYIPANCINSYDASGRPNGVMGVPDFYKPAHTLLIPMPKDGGSPSDPLYAFYDSNTVWVTLKNGNLQRVTLDTGLNPWRDQYALGLYNWYQNASSFKVIPVHETVFFRLNVGFFNVFNIPGILKTPSASTRLIDAQYSGNGARALQFGLRLTW